MLLYNCTITFSKGLQTPRGQYCACGDFLEIILKWEFICIVSFNV